MIEKIEKDDHALSCRNKDEGTELFKVEFTSKLQFDTPRPYWLQT